MRDNGIGADFTALELANKLALGDRKVVFFNRPCTAGLQVLANVADYVHKTASNYMHDVHHY